MIADSGFPVCYGEKGILEGRMVSVHCVTSQVLDIYGGVACNMIPDRAGVLLEDGEALREELGRLLGAEDGWGGQAFSGPGVSGWLTRDKEALGGAVLERKISAEQIKRQSGEVMERAEKIVWRAEQEGIRVIAHGTSKHSAFPEGSVNAIHELCDFLRKLSTVSETDRAVFAGVEKLSREYYGVETGIAYEDEVSGKTTCAATMLALEEGHVCLTLNIRYAITAEDEDNIRTLEECGIANGMQWQTQRNSKPSYFPREHPAVDRLTTLYNDITGRDTKSFVMGGGTYARKLPNAFAYGVGGMREEDSDREAKKKLFKPGHGGAHEPDEALNLRLLLEAMKIYAMAVVELNEVEI